MKKLKVGLIVDDGEQSYSNFDLYRRSLDGLNYSIECLIVQRPIRVRNESTDANMPDLEKVGAFKRFVDRLLLSMVEKFEMQIARRNAKFQECLELHSLARFEIPKINVEPTISEAGLDYTYSEADLKELRSKELDVLVHGGSGVLRGDILATCPYGIISLQHSKRNNNISGPPGFWEVLNRDASTEFVVQRQSPDSEVGDVLFRGSIATTFLYTLNACRLRIKSSVFLHKTLENIAKREGRMHVFPESPPCKQMLKSPSAVHTFTYLLKTFTHGSRKVIGKLAGRTYRWSVAYQYTDDWKGAVLGSSTVIKNPPRRFLADPFVITRNGQTVVFAEDYDYRTGRGKISAFEISLDGNKELGVALDENFHLSYPFLFCKGDDLYMIPETHQAGEIRIYKSVDFPLKWDLHRAIMKGVSAADTGIFRSGEKYWMFTNMDSSELGDHGSELHVFYADRFDSTEWNAHPNNPVIVDSMRGRNGGLILFEDEVYRVFQSQGFDMYGAAMGIAKVTCLDEDRYDEELLLEIPAKFMKDIRGAHTFSFDAGVLCLDFVKYEGTRS